MSKYTTSYGLGFLTFRHARDLELELDRLAKQPVNENPPEHNNADSQTEPRPSQGSPAGGSAELAAPDAPLSPSASSPVAVREAGPEGNLRDLGFSAGTVWSARRIIQEAGEVLGGSAEDLRRLSPAMRERIDELILHRAVAAAGGDPDEIRRLAMALDLLLDRKKLLIATLQFANSGVLPYDDPELHRLLGVLLADGLPAGSAVVREEAHDK